jgi:hypothetical protein
VVLVEPDLVDLDQQLIDPFPLQTVAPSYRAASTVHR